MSDALDEAVEALDRVEAARPKLDGEALTAATKALCRHRDALRRAMLPQAPAPPGLKAVNGSISLVHALHFPMGEAPWTLLDEARKAVAALRRERPAKGDAGAGP